MKQLFKRNKVKTKKAKKPSFSKIIKNEETRVAQALANLTPGTKEYREMTHQLNELRGIRKDDRPSAENVLSAATSIGGLGMAIGYDQTHNLSRHAASFIRRPKG